MGRTCKSWRYHATSGHSGHLPGGKCRQCWTPCRSKLTKPEWQAGKRRCEACVDAILQSPEIAVRRALVDEPDLDTSVLRVLVTDPNGPIALAAERALEARGLNTSPHDLADVPRSSESDRERSDVEAPHTPTSTRSVW